MEGSRTRGFVGSLAVGSFLQTNSHQKPNIKKRPLKVDAHGSASPFPGGPGHDMGPKGSQEHDPQGMTYKVAELIWGKQSLQNYAISQLGGF